MSIPYQMAWQSAREIFDSIIETCKALEPWIKASSPPGNEKLLLMANYYAFDQSLDILRMYKYRYPKELPGFRFPMPGPASKEQDIAWLRAIMCCFDAVRVFLEAPEPGWIDRVVRESIWGGIDMAVDAVALKVHFAALNRAERQLMTLMTSLHNMSRAFYPEKVSQSLVQDMESFDARHSPAFYENPQVWRPRISFRNFKYSILSGERFLMWGRNDISPLESACGAVYDSLAAQDAAQALIWQQTQARWSTPRPEMRVPQKTNTIWEEMHATGIELAMTLKSIPTKSLSSRIGIILPGDSQIYWPREMIRLPRHGERIRCVLIKAIIGPAEYGSRLSFRGVQVESWNRKKGKLVPQSVDFLQLPPEMRNMVYKEVTNNHDKALGPPELFLANRQVHDEFMSIFRDRT